MGGIDKELLDGYFIIHIETNIYELYNSNRRETDFRGTLSNIYAYLQPKHTGLIS